MRLSPDEIEQTVALFRERLMSSHDVDVEWECGQVEVPTMGPHREFKPGATRVVITFDKHLGGLDGHGRMTPDDHIRWMIHEARNA